MTAVPLSVVLVEDNPLDAELVINALGVDGMQFTWIRVQTEAEFVEALRAVPDIVLSDYDLPQFSGLRALDLLRQRHSEIPFILISGTIGEDTAVEAMRKGATDYLLKDRLARLGTAVRNALAESKLLQERRGSDEQLRLANEELRQREAWFRLLIENATDLIVVVDPAGIVRYHSPSSLRYLGFNPEEIVGRPVRDFIHPDDVKPVHEALQRARVGAQRATPIEYRLRHKNGSWRVIQSHGRSAVGRDGQALLVINSRDITDTHHLEEQFRHAQKMEAIGTLAGGIAHDFNNILTAISGYAELAKLEIDNREAVLDHLQAVTEAGRRVTALVRQILSFSRQREQERKPIQLWPIIDEAMKLLRATIPSTIEFHVSLVRQAPTVLADPTQIHQLIMNLATNAAHAMRERAGRLSVLLDVHEIHPDEAGLAAGLQPGRYLRLQVSDTGHGMDPITLNRIFDPFFTTKGPGEGTGLGLAVVHGIVQSHDGVIQVSSEPERGTRFVVYFPVHLGEAIEPPSLPDHAPRGRGQSILVVDDEAPIANMVKRIFERLGYRVTAVTAPAEALERLRSDPHHYDLLVTDLTMPYMTGTELAQHALRIRSDLPVVLTTGFVASLTPDRVRALGIRQLLPKPLTLQGLANAAHSVFENGTV